MNKPVTLLVIGAGCRGSGYAGWALLHPERARVIGVADPYAPNREGFAATHGIAPENVYHDWQDAAGVARFADAVIIGTQDAMHTGPAVAFARLGYHVLLEKPMAQTEAECRLIVDEIVRAGVLFSVGHVLRYTPHTRALKRFLDTGALGDIVSLQHLEPVGYWHMAHSFVRGNWRREDQSSPMLMAKSCHDLDWMRYIMGARCEAVSSFGSLKHFRAEERPADAGENCMDCAFEPRCPYSARRLYLERCLEGDLRDLQGWLLRVLRPRELTHEGVAEALRDGPYGRCVYRCDNDVVDHQIVNMAFEGGRTASFTMTAFTPMGGRRTRIFGTRGEVETDSSVIRHHDFLTEQTSVVFDAASDQSLTGGHGGGDEGLMEAFTAAVAANDPGLILSGPQETLESHLLVFAAERARRENRVVSMDG